MRLPPSKTDPELIALLDKARGHEMTDEEKRAQRRSWVVGEMMLQHPDMTLDEANEHYDRMLKEMGHAP